MSFLEAMAMGRAVIAPNQATMNEYIKNGENGYLYELNKPRELRFGNVREVQKNCLNFMKSGYDNWLQNKNKILVWVEESANPNMIKIQIGMFRRFWLHPIEIIKTWMKYGK